MTTLAQQFGITADQARTIAQTGFELAAAGDFEGALVIFDGMLVLNPEDGSMHAARGAVLEEQGQPAEAEAAYNRAIEIDARTPLARCNRGVLRIKRGDATGVEDLEIAARIESTVQARAANALRMAKR